MQRLHAKGVSLKLRTRFLMILCAALDINGVLMASSSGIRTCSYADLTRLRWA